MKRYLIVAFILLLHESLAKDLHAAWIDASECPDEATTISLIKILRENGVNRVYVGAWKNGQVFYESPTMRNAIGEKGIGRMIIPWFLKYAKPYGIEVHGWFEYGYIAAPRSINTTFGLYALKKGWIIGECDRFYYMDPRSDATDLLLGILIDSIDAGLDGVQFDDHFSCPTKFPQCSAEIVMNAAKYIREKLVARFKEKMVPMSIAPAGIPNAMRDYKVDWRGLMLKGYFDELIPLLYTNSSEIFQSLLTRNEMFWPEFKSKVLIGVMINGDGAFVLTHWEQVLKMLNLSKQKGYDVVIWYGKAIAVDYRKEFYELWGNSSAELQSD